MISAIVPPPVCRAVAQIFACREKQAIEQVFPKPFTKEEFKPKVTLKNSGGSPNLVHSCNRTYFRD